MILLLFVGLKTKTNVCPSDPLRQNGVDSEALKIISMHNFAARIRASNDGEYEARRGASRQHIAHNNRNIHHHLNVIDSSIGSCRHNSVHSVWSSRALDTRCDDDLCSTKCAISCISSIIIPEWKSIVYLYAMHSNIIIIFSLFWMKTAFVFVSTERVFHVIFLLCCWCCMLLLCTNRMITRCVCSSTTATHIVYCHSTNCV